MLKVGIKAHPRYKDDPNYPGHVGLSWRDDERRVYRDFRFRVTDLPQAYQPDSRWRDFFLERKKKVPGYISYGLMLLDRKAQRPGELLCLEWAATETQLRSLKSDSPLGQYGWYSFQPEPEKHIHNCVTWAFITLNKALGNKLPPVPGGRMRLAVEALLELGATPST